MQPYIVGYHGCSPELSKKHTDDTRYFTVPEKSTVVLFNNNGVSSNGDRNIPFIVNLFNTHKKLFDYIFDGRTYKINLDKTNVKSYRHPDFFKQFPFYSSFNFLCNFEMYPSGTHCPEIHLHPSTRSNPGHTYFEGITHIENIITPLEFGILPDFYDESAIKKRPNMRYTKSFFLSHMMDILSSNDEEKIYFISACRVEYYFNPITDTNEYFEISINEKNCKNFDEYDIHIANQKYANATNLQLKNNIDIAKQRLILRNITQQQIKQTIADTFNDEQIVFFDEMFENSMKIVLHELLLSNDEFEDDFEREIVINFRKILLPNVSLSERIDTIRRSIKDQTRSYEDIYFIYYFLRYIKIGYELLEHYIRTTNDTFLISHYGEMSDYEKFSYVYDIVDYVLLTAGDHKISFRSDDIMDVIIHYLQMNNLQMHNLQRGGMKKYIKYIKKVSNILDKKKKLNK